MKLSHVFAFLILFTLLYEAQGINRKLMTKGSSSANTKNYKNYVIKDNPQAEMKSTRENYNVSSWLENSNNVLTHHQDVIDLAGMDYVSPRRKTPIHN
ncbi:hypothetical protein R6Q57_009836 [Mikania cordata]